MTLEIEGFEDLNVQIDRIINDLVEVSDKHDRGTIRSAIVRGMSSAMADVTDEAKKRARRYVPAEEAERITHQSRGFIGDEYRHDMFSDSVIVASHEFGSGIHSLNNRGTVDVPGEGYFIPKPLSSGPLRLRGHPADTDDSPIIVEYVVHPGVEPKLFMRRAVEENIDMIEDRIADQIDQILDERNL